MLEKAILIATIAHKGQIDKGGAPYIMHLIRVMNAGNTENEKICGILHDLIEDTEWTFEKLKEETPPQVLWTITDAINDTEEAMWFYTRYISLTDLNNDGYVDPIVLYGTQSESEEPNRENRVKFIIYYLGKKTAIRHQNSSLDDERHTQIDRSYYKLPSALKRKIRSIVATLEERGHALFNTETIKELEK